MKKSATKLDGLAEVLSDIRRGHQKLCSLRDKRNTALQKLESDEIKKKLLPGEIFRQQMEAKTKAREDSQFVFQAVKPLLLSVAGEAPRWTRQALMRQSRFFERPKGEGAVTSEEKRDRRLEHLLAEMVDGQRRLYVTLALPGMSGAELLDVARGATAEESPAMLYAVSQEYNRRPVKADDVQQGRQKVELMQLVDSIELPGEKEAQQLFSEVEELARQTELLEDDLVRNDARAPKVMSDEELLKQFHQRNQ